ncbi:MAG: creatininase family protein [Anaerolineaceae bacterium]|nr:creatininase family protein [Anaerolineaceae bacterium]
MMNKYKLANLTREDVENRIKEGAIAILPIGATEQHGPHLPMGTDFYLAEFLATKVAEKINGIILPTIPFGYSWVWQSLPGTVSIKHRTLELFISDVIESAKRSGYQMLVIINGHESNTTTLKYVVRDYAENSDFPVYYFFYPEFDEVRTKYCESKTWFGMIHACEFETSLMLASNPELVHPEKATLEYPPYSYEYKHASRELGEISKSGIFGDATLASSEKGDGMLNDFAQNIVTAIEALRKDFRS